MKKEKFAGDKKEGKSFFWKLEKKFVSAYVGKIPKWIETYHLTLLTILWSGLILFFGYLAKNNINWFFGISLLIVFQYFTDLFDGAVGRHRKTGLVKWGYFMDHFLDYVFLYSILIAYTFVLPEGINLQVILIGAILGAFMVQGFLSFAATNKFRISYFGIGPTEVRLALIVFNTLIVFYGAQLLEIILPYVFVLSLIGLVIVTYRTQKELWKLDMSNKRLRN